MLTRFREMDFTSLLGSSKTRAVAAIYFSNASIKIVKVEIEQTEKELELVFVLDLPQELQDYAWIDKADKLAIWLKNSCPWQEFARSTVSAVLEMDRVCLQELSMPPLTDAELEQAIKWDAVQYLPYQEGRYCYGYIKQTSQSEHGQGLKISLLASENRLAEAIILVCRQLRLQLAAITVSSLALQEFAKHQYQSYAVLDIGWEKTNITIFEGLRPVSSESIALGNQNLVALVMERLNLSAAQARSLLESEREVPELQEFESEQAKFCHNLAVQTSLVLERYLLYSDVQFLEALLLFGSLPAVQQTLHKTLTAELNICCSAIEPLAGFYLAEHLHVNTKAYELSVPLGAVLALSKAEQFSIAPLDSHKVDYSYKVCQLLAIGCACLLIGMLAYQFILLNIQQNEASRLSAEYDQLALWRRRSEIVTQLESDSQKRETLSGYLQTNRTAWPQVLLAFGYNIPKGLSIISISRVREEDVYLLRGKAERVEAVGEFINALQKTGIFNSIRLQQLNESGGAQTLHEFLINLKGMGRAYAADMEVSTDRQ